MLQNPHKTLGFKKNMVYEIPPWGGGKPYPASGLSFLDWKTKYEFINSVDPDEMPLVASHQGLHCLLRYNQPSGIQCHSNLTGEPSNGTANFL